MSSLLLLFLFFKATCSIVLKVDTLNADEMAAGQKANYFLTLTLIKKTNVTVYVKLPCDVTSLFTVSNIEISGTGKNLILQKPLPSPILKEVKENAGKSEAVWELGMVDRINESPAEQSDDELVVRATIQAQDHPQMTENNTHWLNFAAVHGNERSQYIVQKRVKSAFSYVLKVDTLNADEMAAGQEANYFLTLALTKKTNFTVYVKLPCNVTSLFTVSNVEISGTGKNLILQKPLPSPILKEVKENTGKSEAVWELGVVDRINESPAEPCDDELVVRATIQAQDHPQMTKNSIHWLGFAAVYGNEGSQYIVQKSVKVLSGGRRLAMVDLQLNSSSQSTYTTGQTMSFGVELFHHYNSRASAENLELIILTQDYLKLASVNAENAVDHAYEVTHNTGTVVIKISYLALHQTLSFRISMVVGAFTSTISSVKAKDHNYTANVIAELHYKELSSAICDQDSPAQIVAKAFDYELKPAQDKAASLKPLNEPFPAIKTLHPGIKCSSCGFHHCCVSENVTINSESYWIAFKIEDNQQFLEFDFRTAIMLKEISLQGSGKNRDAFVKSFSLMSSNDGIRWTTQIYRGKKQVYVGNSDSETVVVRKIKPVLKTRFIRVIPLTWSKRAALRVEFFIKSDDIEAFQIYGEKLKQCVGNNGGDSALNLIQCSTTSHTNRWMWTDNEQLLHFNTSKCLSRMVDGSVQLQVCDSVKKSQKWYCLEEKLLTRSDDSVLHLHPDQGLGSTTIDKSIENDIVKIYSNKKSVCSKKGDPPLALRQMLWNNKKDTLFVCDLNSKSEETANHCIFTKDEGETWQDLDVQLLNVLGISPDAELYGLTFGQKNVLKFLHYGFTINENFLKSEWEKVKGSTPLMEFPVNIPFIPFGESLGSEVPTEEMTLRSSDGSPAWGASSAGIHRHVAGKWNLVLSWSKLGTRYARPGSCKQILAFGQSTGDGIYTIYPAHPLVGISVYCDMTRNDGGWTLLVTSKTAYWNTAQVYEHTPDEPSIVKDHSILKHANAIKDQTEENCFKYRLEAKEFGQHGGMWVAPKSYSFVAKDKSQTNVQLLSKFGDWDYSSHTIEQRMPWICENCPAILTTAANSSEYFGSILSGSSYDGQRGFPAPWMNDVEMSPGIIWYWIKEGC